MESTVNTPRSRSSPIWFYVLLAVLGWLIAFYAVGALLLIFAGILLGVFFHIVGALLRRILPLSERASVLVGLLALTLVSVVLFLLFAPEISSQLRSLAQQAPALIAELSAWMKRYLPFDLSLEAASLGDGQIMRGAVGIVSGSLGAAGSALIILFLGIFFALEPGVYVRGVVWAFPPSQRALAHTLCEALGRVLQRWLIAKIASMSIVAVMTAIGLWMLGVPAAVGLSLIAALFTFIPNIGPFIGAVPAVAVAYLESPTLAFYVIVLYTAIQLIESYLITPLIQKEAVLLPPAVILSAQLVCGVLFGFIGLALATPLIASFIEGAKVTLAQFRGFPSSNGVENAGYSGAAMS